MVAVREVGWQLRLLLWRVLVYILAETMAILRSDQWFRQSVHAIAKTAHLK